MGRRLAEDLSDRYESLLADAGQTIDSEICAAAGLAHDLGHPPFGHVTEDLLRDLVTKAGDTDGYEGNAQSFRIVTRLAAHRLQYAGLDLTRSTLAAILKYPYLKRVGEKKFGAYKSDLVDFEFATKHETQGRRSLEAEVMNYADDIAYSVHDFEDFLRAGLLPLDRILSGFGDFLEAWRCDRDKPALGDIKKYKKELSTLLTQFALIQYDGSIPTRAALRTATSYLIGEARKVVSIRQLAEGSLCLEVDDRFMLRLRMLQRIVWVHVIDNPRLGIQQAGQRQIISRLFECFSDAARKKKASLIPAAFAEDLDTCYNDEIRSARLAADVIASLTDAEAVYTYRRISGVSLGSVLDRV